MVLKYRLRHDWYKITRLSVLNTVWKSKRKTDLLIYLNDLNLKVFVSPLLDFNLIWTWTLLTLSQLQHLKEKVFVLHYLNLLDHRFRGLATFEVQSFVSSCFCLLHLRTYSLQSWNTKVTSRLLHSKSYSNKSSWKQYKRWFAHYQF